MATIGSLEAAVQARLEDDLGIFWLVAPELRPLVVEAMNIAALITGEPQVKASTVYTIPASTVFTPLPLPPDGLALLRMEGPGSLAVEKSYVQDLDNFNPGWEVETGDVPTTWGPFGLGQFFVSPNLTAPVQVILSYVQFPVSTPRPYTGAETIPFQQEYFDGLTDWAAAIARFKESGAEFQEAIPVLNRALAKFEELSTFAYRKGSLRFTRGSGATSNIVETRVR
jgi:hypothetical protein